MRTVSVGEQAAIEARQSKHYVRVEIKDAGGAWVAYDLLSSLDWQDSVEITQSVDQRVAQATVMMAREADANSLAPFINSDIDAGREIRISAARIGASATVVSGDYKRVFEGWIDSWDCTEVAMQLVARDKLGLLQDRWVEDEKEYGSASGVAIETVIQQIVDDWADGGLTLYVPSSPGFLVTTYRQQKEPVLSAVQTLADLIGWVVEYRWDNGTGAYRLTFYEPDRTPASTAWTFGPDNYYGVTRMAVDRLDIRNVVSVRYTDSTTGARSKYTATDATSVTRYGRRWMEIEEGDDSPIDTDAEATTLGDAALADLSAPVAEHGIETDLFWPVQLGDFYEFEANDVHYDLAQEFAVTGFTHRFEGGSGVTTLMVRGQGAVGHTRGWLERESRPRDPADVRAALGLLGFREVSRTTTRVTYAWKLGTDLDEAWVHDYQEPQPYSEDKWPPAARVPDAIVAEREATYTVAIPEQGQVGYLQVEGRREDGSVGEMERVLLFPLSTPADYIAFAMATVRQSDGSVKITGWTTDRALSVAYAYNVGEAAATSPPSQADAEGQGGLADGGGLVTGFTSDFEISLAAGTVGYGEVVKGLLIAYINADGTGPDGTAEDHDTPVGFQAERIKITSGDALADGVVVARALTESARKFGFTGVFSATDWNTVAWTSGTLYLADGDSYAILSGNVDMPDDDLLFVYFRAASSTTTLQSTDNLDTATAEGAILLATLKRAPSSSQEAFYVPAVGKLGLNEDNLSVNSVSTDIVQANAITAAKVNVASLSALSADLGTVTAGTIEVNVLVAAESFAADSAVFEGAIIVGNGGVYSGVGIINGGSFDVLDNSGDGVIGVRGGARQIAFFDKADVPITQPTVSGARDDSEAALANLLTALDDLGLINNTTTAT